ncbi:conserved hypothetical protein [Rhodobacteraceae bacterium KLH11]|nr:conserved hypothetical protein [Rhodobacteraceae bacterium KLH11]
MAVLTAALLALGAAQAKPASGGYQLFEPVALEHQHAIQLASLGNFDYHAKVASECCNATNKGLLPDRYDLDAEIDGIRSLGDPSAGVVNTDRVRPVNGRVPINSQQYAGTTFELSGELGQRYPHGVPFSGAGYPDFSRYSQANVRIELTGSRSADFAAANRAAGLDSTPPNMTWHHHQDAGYMQLVPTDLHETVRHTGGVATSGITPYR